MVPTEAEADDRNEPVVTDWRARARADSPTVVRTIVRAITVGNDDEPAPGGVLARHIVSSISADDGEFGGSAIGQMAALVYGKQWFVEGSASLPASARMYMDNLLPQTLGEFLPSNVPGTLAQDLGDISEPEFRWLAALAMLELRLLGPEPTSSRPAPTGPRQQTRYIVYQYCISLVLLSFKRSSGPIAVPVGGGRLVPGLRYVLVSLIAGWWGIPWGPLWTIETVVRNLRGGIDVTEAVHAFANGGTAGPSWGPSTAPLLGSPDGWR